MMNCTATSRPATGVARGKRGPKSQEGIPAFLFFSLHLLHSFSPRSFFLLPFLSFPPTFSQTMFMLRNGMSSASYLPHRYPSF